MFTSTVFVAGSRQIFRLPAEVRSRLDTMIEKGFQILVGDANGVDKAVLTIRSAGRAETRLGKSQAQLGADHVMVDRSRVWKQQPVSLLKAGKAR